MAGYYLDTSTVARLYITEIGSDTAINLVEAADKVVILEIARLEMRAAVRRRQRGLSLILAEAEDILQPFDHDCNTFFSVSAVSKVLLDLSHQLIDRHALRTLDALQVGGCLLLHQPWENGPVLLFGSRAFDCGEGREHSMY